jgi:hypothetical protein
MRFGREGAPVYAVPKFQDNWIIARLRGGHNESSKNLEIKTEINFRVHTLTLCGATAALTVTQPFNMIV